MSEVDSVHGEHNGTAALLHIHRPARARAVKPKLCEECGFRAFGAAGRRMRYCPQCLDAMYCSRTCQRAAWQTHYTECGRRSQLRSTLCGLLQCKACEDEL